MPKALPIPSSEIGKKLNIQGKGARRHRSVPKGGAGQLLGMLHNPACLLDEVGDVLHINAAWTDQLGTDGHQIGDWTEVVDTRDRYAALSRLRLASTEGRRTEFEGRLLDRSGTPRWFLLSLQPQPADAANRFCILCTATDIDYLKTREIDLDRLGRIQTDMLNISVDCIKLLSVDGLVVHMNKAGCRALGVPEGSNFGMQWLSLLPKDVRAAGTQALACAARGISARFPGRSEIAGEKPQYWDNMLTPVIGRDGRAASILCVSREVTAEREAHEALRRSEERLSSATRAVALGCFEFLPESGAFHLDERCLELLNISDQSLRTSFAETLTSYINPSDRRILLAALDAALASGDSHLLDREFRVSNATGGERIVLAKGLVFREGDVPPRLVGTLQDVTEERRVQRRLREAEQRFRLAARATRDVIWDCDLTSGRTVWNEALASYGYDHDDEAHTTSWWLDAIHPDDRHRVRASLMAAIEGDRTDWMSEYRFRRADGRYVDVRDRGNLLRDESGQVVRMVGAMTDQMAQKAIERRLKSVNDALDKSVNERTRELDRLWRTSPDLLLIIGKKGIVQRINPAWQSVLGYADNDLVGHQCVEFLAPEDIHSASDALERANHQIVTNFECRILHRDGSPRCVSWVAAPSADDIFALGRDVTEERATQAALRRTEDALRQSQKMEAIGQLTGNVAHDFNNLLTVIRGAVSLLRQPDLADARKAHYLCAIADTTERAAKLTSQLLAFARRSPLSPETFDVGANILALEEMMRTLVGKGVSLDIEVPEGEDCLVHADSNQFDTAVINMVVNARDAMDGQGDLKIRVAAVAEIPASRNTPAVRGSFVAVSIKDTGSGIPEDRVDTIFEPFFTTKPVGQGTGLGLSQVFGFVKQSGGEVRLDSQLGVGSIFTIYLLRQIN